MNTQSKNFIAELAELNAEAEREKLDAMSAGERKLKAVASKLLQLERDLAIPGAAMSDSTRQQRILDILQDEEF
jgi:hypothetical protein